MNLIRPAAPPARLRTVLLWLCAALLLASLFLPAVQGSYLKNQPSVLPGWAAMFFSLIIGAGNLGDALTRPGHFHPLTLLPFCAALLNLNFIAAGICLYRRRGQHERGALPRWLLASTLCGLILAIVSPFALHDGEILRPGFYVWLLAHACLLGAIVLARRANHTIRSSPRNQ